MKKLKKKKKKKKLTSFKSTYSWELYLKQFPHNLWSPNEKRAPEGIDIFLRLQ